MDLTTPKRSARRWLKVALGGSLVVAVGLRLFGALVLFVGEPRIGSDQGVFLSVAAHARRRQSVRRGLRQQGSAVLLHHAGGALDRRLAGPVRSRWALARTRSVSHALAPGASDAPPRRSSLGSFVYPLRADGGVVLARGSRCSALSLRSARAVAVAPSALHTCAGALLGVAMLLKLNLALVLVTPLADRALLPRGHGPQPSAVQRSTGFRGRRGVRRGCRGVRGPGRARPYVDTLAYNVELLECAHRVRRRVRRIRPPRRSSGEFFTTRPGEWQLPARYSHRVTVPRRLRAGLVSAEVYRTHARRLAAVAAGRGLVTSRADGVSGHSTSRCSRSRRRSSRHARSCGGAQVLGRRVGVAGGGRLRRTSRFGRRSSTRRYGHLACVSRTSSAGVHPDCAGATPAPPFPERACDVHRLRQEQRERARGVRRLDVRSRVPVVPPLSVQPPRQFEETMDSCEPSGRARPRHVELLRRRRRGRGVEGVRRAARGTPRARLRLLSRPTRIPGRDRRSGSADTAGASAPCGRSRLTARSTVSTAASRSASKELD